VLFVCNNFIDAFLLCVNTYHDFHVMCDLDTVKHD
jgi:hypothetical protein